MSYLNERSVVTEVYHVSSLGLGLEFSTSTPATPKLLSSHIVFTDRGNKLAYRQQTGCFLEGTLETKLYNS